MKTFKDMKILGVVDAIKLNPIPQKAIECTFEALSGEGVTTQMYHLGVFDVYQKKKLRTIPLEAYDFRQQVQQADAIVFATTELKETFSPLLKQALDYLKTTDLTNKPVGCIGIGTGTAGGARAMVSLMEKMHSMDARPVSCGVFISSESLVMSTHGFEAFSRTIYRQLQILGHEIVFTTIQKRSA
jgi:chromate reductase, NAD(P)H dehydrogenase (quinone)